MKKCIKTVALLIVFYSIISNSFAQDTIQQWNVGVYDESFSSDHPSPTWYTYLIKSMGDTLINYFEYNKLYRSYDSLFVDYSYYGGIREDSGRVILNMGDNSEDDILLYDYSLNAGDTTTIYRKSYSQFYPYLVTVDSIKERQLNENKLKECYVTYSVHTMNMQDVWLEGVGSVNHGLLNESCFGGTGCYLSTYLLCYKENDIILVQDTSFNNCFKETIISGIKDESSIPFRIYPSLVTSNNEITVESESLINQIKIFNSQGLLVYSENVNTYHHKVNIDNLSNGFYMVAVNELSTKLLIAR